MKTLYSQFLSRFHLWTDLILLNLSYLLASQVILSNARQMLDIYYLNLLLLSNLIWVLCIYITKQYSFTDKNYDTYDHLCKLLITIVGHFVLLEIFLYMNGDMFNKREHLAFTAFEIFSGLVLLTNIPLMLSLQYLRKASYAQKTYAVVTNGKHAGSLDRFHEDRKKLGFNSSGIFDLGDVSTSYEQLEDFIHQEQPDYVYCWLSGMHPDVLKRLIKLAETTKTHVRLISDHAAISSPDFQVEHGERSPFLYISKNSTSEGQIHIAKRSFDLTFSLIVVIIGLPMFLLIAALIKLTSQGPVFSREPRIGRRGSTFSIIKFRTTCMEAGSKIETNQITSKTADLTPIGYFLQRSRLDEMPQFFNVLKGEMSVVGPRPYMLPEAEMLAEKSLANKEKLLNMLPGITSIGPIRDEGATSVTENSEHEMSYLHSYSLIKDLQMIALTIQLLMLGKGR